jgi:hypothetical protein
MERNGTMLLQPIVSFDSALSQVCNLLGFPQSREMFPVQVPAQHFLVHPHGHCRSLLGHPVLFKERSKFPGSLTPFYSSLQELSLVLSLLCIHHV